MIRHIVIWDLKDELSDEEKINSAQKIKSGLEELTQYIDGIIELEVVINPLSTSTSDILLNGLYKNQDTLNNYQNHQKHKEIGAFVKSVVKSRRCIDYEVIL